MKTVKPGIRIKPSGKFIATKSIDGKRFYHEFDTLREATKWKNEFHPLVKPNVDQRQIIVPTVSDQSNGRDTSIKFGEVVERYKNGRMKTLSVNKQYKKGKRMDRFLPPLYSVRMCELNPEVITKLIEKAKLSASDTFGRCNFNEEIKDLNGIFSWYKDEIDFTFHNPVTKYHKAIGKIKDVEYKTKYLNEEQLLRFIDHLEEPFQSMAVIQFCLALRIGEVAGINTNTVDFKNETISISEVITWLKNKPTHKKNTKTGDKTILKMNSEIIRRLRILDKQRPKGCKFFFHHKGGPAKYDVILDAYNTALKNAGLSDFSGTHLVRHTMGTMARRKSGLDAAQAILRHTTSRMAEHYAKLDVNDKASKVVIEAGEIFLRGRATNATKSDENVESLTS